MACCGNCFGDSFLCIEIERLSTSIGACSYCGRDRVPLIEPSLLIDAFERVYDALYELSNSEGAFSLRELLRADWLLFPELDDDLADQLLEAIIPGVGYHKFVPIVDHDEEAVIKWDQLREELKHENRYFPQTMTFDDTREGSLFSYLSSTVNLETPLYRARLLRDDVPYSIAQMGAPPSKIASSGRANPIGIPYLYVATTEETAVAETRPFTGATVCIAKYEILGALEVADLCDPTSRISPFLIQSDEESLRLVRKYMPFLVRMGEELSMPVSPYESHLEYLPSQYICEFLKHLGFDGVAYKSSVGPGLNYAIFKEESVRGISVTKHKVSAVNIVISAE